MTEDAGECPCEQAAAPFFYQLARPLGAVLQVHHHVSEESEIADVIVHTRLLGGCLADVAQGHVSPFPDGSEHGAMHVLQRLPLADFILVPPCNDFGIVDPSLKKERLGAGGGQLSLRRA